ncbi:MAG: hypothetical protein Ta2A_05390 [Treponemataceae bacterium]|nr:MAG: hypothetical protein Ta2A_05390 [Treponemataceae bacterium]
MQILEIQKTIQTEIAILANIDSAQKKVRDAVCKRDWAALESELITCNALASSLAEIEKHRIESMQTIPQAERQNDELQNGILTLRKKLLEAKIKNDALNRYVSARRDFLQTIFDTALPARRNCTYSRTGSVMRNEPERLVLDIGA